MSDRNGIFSGKIGELAVDLASAGGSAQDELRLETTGQKSEVLTTFAFGLLCYIGYRGWGEYLGADRRLDL